MHNKILRFFYGVEDFNYVIESYQEKKSLFDNILWEKWKEAEEAKVFRYTLHIQSSKTLKGKYRFLAQLNPNRADHRRMPESIISMFQPFNRTGFNFTKLTDKEILFNIGNNNIDDIVAINASPLEQGHCLLITQQLKCLPQVITKYSLRIALELCLLSNSWSFRVVFNSLCAHASVNHLHWHIYYLEHEMLLEYIDTFSFTSDVHLLLDYPAKGLCLKLSAFKNIKEFISRTFLIVNYLQLHEIAHNVYITRAKSKSGDWLHNDVRIYIWVRKPFIGIKDTVAFVPGVCELFGHLSIKDETLYKNLVEEDVINILNDITAEPFLLIKDKLRCYLEIHSNKG